VFQVFGWDPEPFVSEIIKQSKGFQPFDFCIRCAAVNRDASGDCYHAFLVPDEGHGKIIKIHDQLYADKLFPKRTLDIDFIPHLSIGNSKDPLKCVEMVDWWNREEFAIPGRIATLDIINYEKKTVRTIHRLSLGE